MKRSESEEMKRSESEARKEEKDERKDGSKKRKNEDTRETVSRRLFEAAGKGELEEVKTLLQHPLVDPSFVGEEVWFGLPRTVLREAAANGHVEVVRALLEDGRANPAAHESVALTRAALRGHAEVVSLLLKDQRADPTAEDNATVRWAAESGRTEVVRLLLRDPRVDPSAKNKGMNSHGRNRLHRRRSVVAIKRVHAKRPFAADVIVALCVQSGSVSKFLLVLCNQVRLGDSFLCFLWQISFLTCPPREVTLQTPRSADTTIYGNLDTPNSGSKGVVLSPASGN